MSEAKAPRATRILIVEDEAIVAQSLGVMLEDIGYEVSGIVDNAQDALAVVEGCDLVLMDINIRGPMDGVELARLVRSRHGSAVIFLTAYSDPGTLERAQDAEPYGYMLKPIDERELRPAIQMALHKHDMEQERARLTAQLKAALDEVEQLRGLLPICAWCKQVRDDDGYWASLEAYLTKQIHTKFTHSICPSCEERLDEQAEREAERRS